MNLKIGTRICGTKESATTELNKKEKFWGEGVDLWGV